MLTSTLAAAAALATTLSFSGAGLAADVTKMARNAPAGASEVACLAEAVYFEAGGTGAKGETAVAHVVVNRAKSSKFPSTVCGVVSQGCQFSYRCDGRSDKLANERQRVHATKVARAVLAGEPDITNGALFFHAASAKPGWFNSRPRVGKIGGNIFYR